MVLQARKMISVLEERLEHIPTAIKWGLHTGVVRLISRKWGCTALEIRKKRSKGMRCADRIG